jgi:hypothetical protein
VITFHENVKNIHVQGLIIDVHIFPFLGLHFLLCKHVLQRGMTQVFEIRFGHRVRIFISVLLGPGAISEIVNFFATIVTLDCLQMVAVVIVDIASFIATSTTSSTNSATSAAIISLATIVANTILVVSTSLTIFLFDVIGLTCHLASHLRNELFLLI